MQVYKSMADVVAGEELYSHYSTVTEEDGGWLSLRDIVLARKMPRRMLVQPLTIQTGKYTHIISFACFWETIITI